MIFIQGQNSAQNLVVKKLKHPKTLKSAPFAVSDTRIFEISTSSKGSWFVDDVDVISSPDYHIFTPIDPFFFVISNKKTVYQSKSDILSQVPCSQDLTIICDLKEYDGEKLYKLNDEKVLKWMIQKVESVATHLKSNDKFKGLDLNAISIGIMREYLSKDLISILYSHFGLNEKEQIAQHQHPSDSAIQGDKKRKLEEEKSAPKKRMSKAEKLGVVVEKNTKSILSFFKK